MWNEGVVPSLVVLLATIVLCPERATAQEHPAGPVAGQPSQGHEGAAEGAERQNALSLFLGGTLETAEDETYFTVGLEYEREIGHRLAVMAVAEHVSDFDAWVFVAPIAFKPIRGLSLMTGPGFETTPRRPESREEEEDGAESGDEGPFFLWRFGVGYTLPLGERMAVTPNSTSTWFANTANGPRRGSSA